MRSLILGALIGLTHGQSAAQEKVSRPLEVVADVDIEQYMGTWYEIARLPNRFQDDCRSDVTATYVLLADGQIKVLNQCRKQNGELSKAMGRARRADDEGPNTKLKVRFAPALLSFLPFVWGNYWIIDLATDYSYAVVGEPKRKYFWVLSRTPLMDEGTLDQILDRARTQGYDLTALLRTQHTM
jgi:apolipoprotein D and lipocalin family protein